jgi:hypothetical protein
MKCIVYVCAFAFFINNIFCVPLNSGSEPQGSENIPIVCQRVGESQEEFYKNIDLLNPGVLESLNKQDEQLLNTILACNKQQLIAKAVLDVAIHNNLKLLVKNLIRYGAYVHDFNDVLLQRLANFDESVIEEILTEKVVAKILSSALKKSFLLILLEMVARKDYKKMSSLMKNQDNLAGLFFTAIKHNLIHVCKFLIESKIVPSYDPLIYLCLHAGDDNDEIFKMIIEGISLYKPFYLDEKIKVTLLDLCRTLEKTNKVCFEKEGLCRNRCILDNYIQGVLESDDQPSALQKLIKSCQKYHFYRDDNELLSDFHIQEVFELNDRFWSLSISSKMKKALVSVTTHKELLETLRNFWQERLDKSKIITTNSVACCFCLFSPTDQKTEWSSYDDEGSQYHKRKSEYQMKGWLALPENDRYIILEKTKMRLDRVNKKLELLQVVYQKSQELLQSIQHK